MFCPKCGKENPEGQQFCGVCGASMTGAGPQTQKKEDEHRKVGILLGLGIFFIPFIFSWFTLRKGHSTLSKVLAFVWLGVVFLSVVASRGGEKTSTTPVVATSGNEVAQPKEVVAEKPAAAPTKMGEKIQLGKFAYVVSKVSKARSVGNDFVNAKASDGAVFLVVDYTIENLGKETETVLTDDFQIVDKQGRTFKASSDANSALAMSGGKDLLLSEIQPGLKRQMRSAFEVPEIVVKEGAKLVIPEKGWGSGKVEIELKSN